MPDFTACEEQPLNIVEVKRLLHRIERDHRFLNALLGRLERAAQTGSIFEEDCRAYNVPGILQKLFRRHAGTERALAKIIGFSFGSHSNSHDAAVQMVALSKGTFYMASRELRRTAANDFCKGFRVWQRVHGREFDQTLLEIAGESLTSRNFETRRAMVFSVGATPTTPVWVPPVALAHQATCP